MKWVYVLSYDDNDYGYNPIYIGETSRLYRRLNEHSNNYNDDTCTGKYEFTNLVGLYKVHTNSVFHQYHTDISVYCDYNPFTFEYEQEVYDTKDSSLVIENWITELIMTEYEGNYHKIRGGKYCRDDIFNKPFDELFDTPLERPFCDCGMPAEIKLNKHNEFYYVCSMTNAWDDFSPCFNVNEPCDYYKKYNDIEARAYHKISKKYVNMPFIENIPNAISSLTPGECVLCHKTRYLPIYSPVYGGAKQICSECLANNHKELERKYTQCMIID